MSLINHKFNIDSFINKLYTLWLIGYIGMDIKIFKITILLIINLDSYHIFFLHIKKILYSLDQIYLIAIFVR